MTYFEPLIARVDALARGDAVIRAKLEAVAALLVRMIPDCDSVSIGIILEGAATTAAASDHVALEVDLLQYKFQEGPCLDSVSSGGGAGQVVRIDLIDDPRYRRFAPGALDAGIASVLSIPCMSRAGRVVGSLNLYSRRRGTLGPAAEAAAAPFAAFVAETISESAVLDAASDLVAEVTTAVERHAIINQAVGLIIKRRGCTAEAALAALGWTATARGQDLPTAARAIVNGRALADEHSEGQ